MRKLAVCLLGPLISALGPDPAPAASGSRNQVEHPHVAELVQLKYFGGLTLAQCAEVLGVSARTADTWWAYARAWLAVRLKENGWDSRG
jgi:hypothetical protein